MANLISTHNIKESNKGFQVKTNDEMAERIYANAFVDTETETIKVSSAYWVKRELLGIQTQLNEN
jgi:hypothetical protein